MTDLVSKPSVDKTTWSSAERQSMTPFAFDEAKRADIRSSDAQAAAEDFLRTAAEQAATAERNYRKALSNRILELKEAGTAWTACGDVARGEDQVADLRYIRDLAEGILEAAKQATFRHAADRRALVQLIDWSMRVSLDGQTKETEGDRRQQPIGGRRP